VLAPDQSWAARDVTSAGLAWVVWGNPGLSGTQQAGVIQRNPSKYRVLGIHYPKSPSSEDVWRRSVKRVSPERTDRVKYRAHTGMHAIYGTREFDIGNICVLGGGLH